MKTILMFGALSSGPFAIAAQVSSDPVASTATMAPWLTAGAVLSLAGLLWKIMNDRLKEKDQLVQALRDENKSLTDAANRRAEEDRQIALPLLSESIKAQAGIISQRLKGVEGN